MGSCVRRWTKASTLSLGSGLADKKTSSPSAIETRSSGETSTTFTGSEARTATDKSMAKRTDAGTRRKGDAGKNAEPCPRVPASPRPRVRSITTSKGLQSPRQLIGEPDLPLEGTRDGEERRLGEPRGLNLDAERKPFFGES